MYLSEKKREKFDELNFRMSCFRLTWNTVKQVNKRSKAELLKTNKSSRLFRLGNLVCM